MSKKKPFILNSSSLILHSQSGMSSVYVIIFITMIVFAIMLAGGGGSLFTGNLASPDIPTPTIDPSALPSGAPTSPPASSPWKISVSLGDCKENKVKYRSGEITADGTATGDMELFSGTTSIAKLTFTPPQQKYNLTLSNDKGFSTTPWKIVLKSSGETKVSYDGVPTGC